MKKSFDGVCFFATDACLQAEDLEELVLFEADPETMSDVLRRLVHFKEQPLSQSFFLLYLSFSLTLSYSLSLSFS